MTGPGAGAGAGGVATASACEGAGGAGGALGWTGSGVTAPAAPDPDRFRAKYGLKVRLLADPEHKAIVPYKVWGPKKLYGRDYMGLIRATYLIDANGNVAEAWKVTRARGHAEKVLDAVKALSQSTT